MAERVAFIGLGVMGAPMAGSAIGSLGRAAFENSRTPGAQNDPRG